MEFCDVAVLGGGISGLTVAYELQRRAPHLSVRVLEASHRLGGNIQTDHHQGFTIEHGPDSFVVGKPHALELCRELGLEAELIVTPEEHRVVYFVRRGELIALPEGLVLGVPTRLESFLKSPLLSPWGKLRTLLEPLIEPVTSARELGTDDESVYDFFARRFGDELASRVMAPLIGGIYAGDVRELGLKATLPQFAQMEAKHGSLVLGMLAARTPGEIDPAARSNPVLRAVEVARRFWTRNRSTAPAFVSFRTGMHRLIDALAAQLAPDVVRMGRRVIGVQKGADSRYVLHTDEAALCAGQVVFSTPAATTATLFPDSVIQSELRGVRSVSTATAVFAWPREGVSHPLRGLGFVAPEGEAEILAATFISSKWPHRVPDGEVLIRAFVGGPSKPNALALDDDRIADLALAELRRLLGRLDDPLFRRVYRYQGASPQPGVGHAARMRRIHRRLTELTGLHLAAGGLDAIGIPDTIKVARAVARQILGAGPDRD